MNVREPSFTGRRRIYLGDATGSGRLRLDALARFLQDVASDHAEQAPIADDTGWVLRRMEVDLERLPTIYEDLELTTWCSGVGGRWAERSTAVADTREVAGGICAMARAIWVYISIDTGTPRPLPEQFFATYGEDVRKMKVSARLHHPAPPENAASRAWPLRTADFDVFGHVNNAVYWAAVEDELARVRAGRRVGHAEIEFRAGIDPGDEVDVVVDAGDSLAVWWMVGADVRASARLDFAPSD